MVPHSIQQNLDALRRRERLLAFAWGLACWLGIVLLLLLLCGFINWLIDRQRDTPWSVRYGLFFVQAGVAFIAGCWFLLLPQLRRLPDATLALWVEDRLPHFGHRLISAVQLNQPGARVEGMSVELITMVTRQAESEAGRVGFPQVADHSRLRWCGMLLAPIALIVAAPFLIWPGICFALLGRQLLLDVDIPNSVRLDSISPEFWPSGEPIPLRYRVRYSDDGAFDPDAVGSLHVSPANQPTDSYPLKFIETRTDAETGEKYAVFGADVHSSTVDVQYRARLADGRTKLPSEVQIVLRPDITAHDAWVLLPEFCGKRPNGQRYERQQKPSLAEGIAGSRVRVQITTRQPIKEGWIEIADPVLGAGMVGLVSSTAGPLNSAATLLPGRPMPGKDKRKMAVASDGLSAEIEFNLLAGMTGYRVDVVDQHGFGNNTRHGRALRVVNEEPPQVTLLRDTFGPKADFDLEGLPVVLGKQIRIPYFCEAQLYGLGKVDILYRVLKKQESGEGDAPEERWVRVSMPEVRLPLAAIGKTLDDLGAPLALGLPGSALYAEQARLKEQTKETMSQNLPAPELAEQQKGLMQKFAKLRNPLPYHTRVAAVLAAPLDQMAAAAECLETQRFADAVEFQEKALAALKNASKELIESTELNPKTGTFMNTEWKEQVSYYRVPSRQPDRDLGFKTGGGRFFLDTKGIQRYVKNLLEPVELKSGDQIEFLIEVYGPDRKDGTVPVARSESRVTTVMRLDEFLAWYDQISDEANRISDLEKKQRGVVDPK